MLEFMRKQAKSWIMKVLLGLIIIVFIFYFGSTGGDKYAQAIAKVDGRIINYADFSKKYSDIYDMYRRFMGGSLPEDFLKNMNLKQQAFDSLINQTIIMIKAEELGISAGDDELRNSIMAYPAFQRDGQFDERQYQYILKQYKMTPEDFEKNQRANIMGAKLEALIKSAAQVSEQEILEAYALQNGKINIEFVRISPKTFINKINPTNTDLERYLKDHAESFRVPEKLQAQYVFFAADNYTGRIDVSDKEIEEYYSFRKAEYEKQGNKSLTSALKGKIAAEIKKAKALDIATEEVKKLRDTVYQYDNLEEEARKNKLEIRSTGFFPLDRPPAEFLQIKDFQKHLADTKKGELSPILATPEGFYLIKVVDVKPSHIPPLAEIRDSVAKKYSEKESGILAGKEADAVLERLKQGEDFKKLSQSKGLKILETGFFVPGISIPKVGQSEGLAAALYELSDKKKYPDSPFNVDGDYIIVRFKERAKVDMKGFEADKKSIRAGYVRMKENTYFQSWLEEQKNAFTKSGKLKIYKQASEL